MKELYEKYHDKGLEVISVSLDDKKINGRRLSNRTVLPWIHVSDLQAWGKSVSEDVGYTGNPLLDCFG